MLNRRTFLRGLTTGVAGLLVPATGLVMGEAAQRRYWTLDQTMLDMRSGYVPMPPAVGDPADAFTGPDGELYHYGEWINVYAQWAAALTPRQDPARSRGAFFARR